MIFYFTGTGNSLSAANKLLSENEKLINIAEAIKKNEFEYYVPKGENIGFVFPVYFYTVPDIISDFISNLKLHNSEYIYAVITCGGGILQTGSVLKKLLKKQGYTLNYVSSILMPDNAILFYQIPTADDEKEKLINADKMLKKISMDINSRKTTKISNISLLSDIVGLGFKLSDKTNNFYADEKCISCGLCEKICPINAIKIKDNKPQWIKPKCTKCSACINRCPEKAIQYGPKTSGRNRYVNPEIL